MMVAPSKIGFESLAADNISGVAKPADAKQSKSDDRALNKYKFLLRVAE